MKDDSLFWHAVWVSAGSPVSGALHQVMSWSRNKYHYAVRKAKRAAGSIKSKALVEAAEKGDLELMLEMKKTLGNKSHCQTVPQSLDGKVTHSSILARFRQGYAELYNSAGSTQATATIKQTIGRLIGD